MDVEFIVANTYHWTAAAAAKLLQLCLTLCNPVDGSPPGPSVPEILQARILEWVAISFSTSGLKVPNMVCCLEQPWCLSIGIDSSPLGFSVPGILQARILEWVASSFSNA